MPHGVRGNEIGNTTPAQTIFLLIGTSGNTKQIRQRLNGLRSALLHHKFQLGHEIMAQKLNYL